MVYWIGAVGEESVILRHGLSHIREQTRRAEREMGVYLDELTDELDGDYITTFVSGGPRTMRTN